MWWEADWQLSRGVPDDGGHRRTRSDQRLGRPFDQGQGVETSPHFFTLRNIKMAECPTNSKDFPDDACDQLRNLRNS